MVAVHKSMKEDTYVVWTTVPDPSTSKVAPGTGKQRPKQNVGTMAGRAIEKDSVERSEPIRIIPDSVRPDKGIGKARTTLKDRKDPRPEIPEKGQPFVDRQRLTSRIKSRMGKGYLF